jgi:acetyl-CoA acetyltransferase
MAGLQARSMLDSGRITAEEMAETAHRNRQNALNNPHAQLKGSPSVDALLAEDYLSNPLRKHDCPPISDGGCAIVLAAGDKAREWAERPAWLKGIDHRVDSHNFGARDIAEAPSIAIAAEKAGASGGFDIAEVHAPFSHQEKIVTEALGLSGDVKVNPSGGALAANPVMGAGLIRLGEVANRIMAGEADRGVAHATSGQLMQQNLVAVLEGDR